jgi:hypothetical protein
MNSSLNNRSAKIYQFPAGGRGALGARRPDEITATADQGSRVSEAACGGGWYHEAAIQESDTERKR